MMQSTRRNTAPARSTTRDKVSNGRLFQILDPRSAPARRFKALVDAYSAELGGELSEAERSLVRQAAALQIQAEKQPFSVSGVYIRTSGSSSFDLIAGDINPNAALFMDNGAGFSNLYAGALSSVVPTTENVLHSFQGVFNSSSSVIYRDTSATTGLNPSTNNLSGVTLGVGAWSSTSDSYVFCETGVWAGAFSSGDYTALGANQHGTNGYNF